MAILLATLFVMIILCILCIIRLYLVIGNVSNFKPESKGRITVLVVAGSGGHTTEMLRLMETLSAAFSPRLYVLADTDRMSEEKVCSFERSKDCSDPQYAIHRIPRSREVHQSWSSSVISTLNALGYSLPLVFRLRPDMVLCNGPGTCVPLCMAGLLLGVAGMKKVLIVYVESVCRVETMSLTGKILYRMSDYFFVQWASLRDRYPKSIFLGRIV
ncbi:UDP-N-acetylglucosamine transferase subunit ALG14 homolog [Dunckerocampus dactyliophorus]|uniref:UDP-N-acetylglucosamine transferase subunit ALG14 homolog n=1 Tax=Dunckerocampus dactyliophorus TaxID=161453 RepID=UPI0024064CFD|nr:UDP-N-acetylglucosamine transferase subunit ALG14 homolog [Dunckerocampus dactyliophorus]